MATHHERCTDGSSGQSAGSERAGGTALTRAVAPARPHARPLRRRRRGLGLRRRHRRRPPGPGRAVGVRARAGARAAGRRLPHDAARRPPPGAGAPGAGTARPPRRPVRPAAGRRPQRPRRLRPRGHLAHQRRRVAAPARLGVRRRAVARGPPGRPGACRAGALVRGGRADARRPALPRGRRALAVAAEVPGARALGPGRRPGPRRHRSGRAGRREGPDRRHLRGRPQRRRARAARLRALRRLRHRLQPPGQEHAGRELPARRGGPRCRAVLRGGRAGRRAGRGRRRRPPVAGDLRGGG